MTERMNELLKNAIICFNECRSPFSHHELSKMDVTSDECGALSEFIASRLQGTLPIEEPYTVTKYLDSLVKVRARTQESAQIAASFGMKYVKMPRPLLSLVITVTDDIKNNLGFLMNFARMDTIRQIMEPAGKEASV